MRKYANKALEKLVRELCAGLVRLRKGYVDAAEALVRIVDPSRTYPYELVVYRLTGYRPRGSDPSAEQLPGKTLRADLLRLMLDVSDSFELRTGAYDEPAYDTSSLAGRFNVSQKTVQRWRRRGLPARRLIFPDGRRRVAFLESSVNWFVTEHRRQVARSTRFRQVDDAERAGIVRRARRMAQFANCSLSDVSRRLAARTGRSPETIRYTIRRHDEQNPAEAVFPYLSAPLGDREKEVIYRCFLRGVPAPRLAERYNRSRGSIYRVVNEMRARQLLHRPISCIYNPEFDLPDADETILGEPSGGRANPPDNQQVKPPPGLPEYFRQLYRVPLLSRMQERDLFRRYNYLKYKADRLRRRIDFNRVRTAQLKRIESLLLQANVVKNRIVRANLRLVVSIAKKHVGGPQNIFELISDGNVSLLRAVEKFDYARGFRFSTYASWAIMRNFARSVPRERYLMDRYSTGHDDILDIAAAFHSYEGDDDLSELRESIDVMLAELSPRERTILIDHYGLDSEGRSKTFEQLGRQLGLSKERVRQIEITALRKLRRVARPRKANLLK